MAKTLVIGLGNPILSDDGVGIHVARRVQDALPSDSDVDVLEACVGGLALMEAMIGYERAILVDALLLPDGDAGQITVFPAGCLPPTLNTSSSHDTNLRTALAVGRQLGACLPADSHIQIVGVQAVEVLAFDEVPTPPVASAVAPAVEMVLKLLQDIELSRFDTGHKSGEMTVKCP